MRAAGRVVDGMTATGRGCFAFQDREQKFRPPGEDDWSYKGDEEKQETQLIH